LSASATSVAAYHARFGLKYCFFTSGSPSTKPLVSPSAFFASYKI
jgi:hypothetical protein